MKNKGYGWTRMGLFSAMRILILGKYLSRWTVPLIKENVAIFSIVVSICVEYIHCTRLAWGIEPLWMKKRGLRKISLKIRNYFCCNLYAHRSPLFISCFFSFEWSVSLLFFLVPSVSSMLAFHCSLIIVGRKKGTHYTMIALINTWFSTGMKILEAFFKR